MASPPAATSPAASPTQWPDLLPDLIGRVLAVLPHPGDRARLRAVCRAWHAAARSHVRQLPWMVFPDGSFRTIGADGADFPRLPGLPENVTCLGTTDDWLALDCTDDVFRRTPHWDKFDGSGFLDPRPDVKHRHTYRLHNPFSRKTVPLPELDSIIGDVAETFEVRKVLMRSSSPDDIVAVTTSNWNYNIILCRPGKGMWVAPNLRVFDVVFHGDRLYGITPEEELVAFDLDEDEDGRPTVTKFWRVIRQALADGEEDPWSWMYNDDEDDDDDDDEEDDDVNNNGESDDNGSDEEDMELPNNAEDDGEESDDQEDESFNDDDMVPDGVDTTRDEEVPYEPKDYITISRHLVESCSDGELLMVRHHMQSPPYSNAYTRKVEILKADINLGKWVPVAANGLAKGEALFLSRSFCKSTRAYGDIKEGFIYFMDRDDVFDTISWSRMPFSWPGRQWMRADSKFLTWLFPPKLVV
ncbi:hypothetical protein ACP4OV_018481 [Aristida adscensionis]